jgi:mannose-6-phosphate isomerase-like protein (cupin superfamily)
MAREERVATHVLNKRDLKFVGSSFHFVGEEQDVAVSIFLLEAKPGRGAPLHVHEYDEIITIQEGIARMVIGNEIREAGPGDIAVIKAGTPHGFINIGDGPLKQVDVHLNPRFEQTNLEPTDISRSVGLPEPSVKAY